jgi:hypothetical protein
MGYEVTHYRTKVNEPSPSLCVRVKRENSSPQKHCVGNLVCLIRDTTGVVQCAPYVPSGASQANQLVATVHRFGRKMPTGSGETLAEFEAFAKRRIELIFTPVSVFDIPSFSEWLSSSGYSGKRRKQLQTIHDNLRHMREEDCINKSFLKWEGYVLDMMFEASRESFPDVKNPRGINSYSDETKVYLGRFIRAVDKATFKHKWFVKGDDPKFRAQKLLDVFGRNPVFCTDFSSFEAHHAGTFARVLRHWMMHMLRCPSIDRHVKALVSRLMMGQNVCKFSTLTATIDQRLMSGALWTSSANGVLNLLIMSFIFAKSSGAADLQKKADEFKGLFEGDDGIFEAFDADYSLIERLGLKLDIQKHEDFSTANFCGVCCDPIALCNTTDPIKMLRNFFLLPKAYNGASDKVKWAYLRAKSLSYKYLYNDCPIVGPLAHRICELTRGYDIERYCAELDSHKRHLAYQAMRDKVWLDVPKVKEETRQVVEKAFRVPKEVQLAIEDAITRWKGGDLFIPSLFSAADYSHAYYFIVSEPTRYPALWNFIPPTGKSLIKKQKFQDTCVLVY